MSEDRFEVSVESAYGFSSNKATCPPSFFLSCETDFLIDTFPYHLRHISIVHRKMDIERGYLLTALISRFHGTIYNLV